MLKVRCTHDRLPEELRGRSYALKMSYNMSSNNTSAAVRRFKDEYAIMVHVPSHPNINLYIAQFEEKPNEAVMSQLPPDTVYNEVIAYENGQPRRTQFCLLEYHPKTLEARVKEQVAAHGTVAAGFVVRVARGMAAALSHCFTQAHVFHLDVKQDNVLMDADDNPVLCDFGVAKRIPREYLNRSVQKYLNVPVSVLCLKNTQLWGNPAHIAPELHNACQHDEPIPFAGQAVFELGVLILEVALGGEHPLPGYPDAFEDRAARVVGYDTPSFPDMPNVSPALMTLLTRMISCNPADRPSLSEVIAQL